MAEDKVLNSVVPPAEKQHTAPEDSGPGKEGTESVPVSTSGPVSEEKVKSTLSATLNPKTDDADKESEGAGVKDVKDVKDKDVKDSSDVGGAETGPIAGEGEKPPPTKTVEEVTKEKEGEESKREELGEKEKETAKEKEVLATNGPDADEEGEPAEEKPGAKRGAVNGGEKDGPAKKAKTEAPTTNGGAAKSKPKREKKQPAPVGQTARRTRSQGLA